MASFKGPKRPESHSTGDIAKGQIIELFSSQKWIIDSTITDYGEDLLLQLTEKTSLIPVRFFIQLKGTKNIKKFEKSTFYSIPKLKQTTVSHWLNSNFSTILILWDITKKQGVYGFVNEVFYKGIDETKKHVTAHISKNAILNKKSISSFKLDGISNYCDIKYKTLAGLENLLKNDENAGEILGMKSEKINRDIVDLIIFYLSSIGIVKITKSGKISANDEFREYIVKELAPLYEKMDITSETFPEKISDVLIESMTLAHMSWRKDKFNHLTQGGLLEATTRFLMVYYNDLVKKILKERVRLLKK
jgi:hypothetical protein